MSAFDDLPRTVPRDPEAVERERAVREATDARDRMLARMREADTLGDVVAAMFKVESDCHGFEPPTGPGWKSEGGHTIDWVDFDRRVDELSGAEARALLKREARLRADGVTRDGDVLATTGTTA